MYPVISLLRAVTVFSMLVIAAWGMGNWILNFIEKDNKVISRFAWALISLNLGLGIAGQSVFIVGTIGNIYRPQIFWFFLIAFVLLALFRLQKEFKGKIPKFTHHEFDKKELLVIAIAIVSTAIWLYGAMNFTRGSDVISHHYQHVKICIKLGHFGHLVTLPSGYDHVSNYNPTLFHMLYLIGILLSDERAANLIHWLSQAMMIAVIYIFSRDFFSRHIGMLAIAIYLGFALLFNFSLDVSDYTALAVFMMISLYFIFLFNKTSLRRHLLLAGVFAGFMLSVKYYGIPLMISLCIPLFFLNSQRISGRFKAVLAFCAVALAVFSPWIIYNLKEFGDPLYPSLSHIDYIRRWTAYRLEDMLLPFIASTDQGYFWPNFFYYLSMFIPFEPGYRVFGLTPIFLIGLPVSFYYLIRIKGEQWKAVNVLFITSIVAFICIDVLGRPFLFYKFGIFPGAMYAVSLSLIFTSWESYHRRWIWTAIILVALLNSYYLYRYIKPQLHFPPVADQSFFWSPLERYLNEHLEKGAVVANHDVPTNYYLRHDIQGIPSCETSIDWHKEEMMIRKANVRYYVFNINEKEQKAAFYKEMIGICDRLSAHGRAVYISDTLKLFLERTQKQESFLRKSGHLVKEFPDGNRIYRLSIAENELSKIW